MARKITKPDKNFDKEKGEAFLKEQMGNQDKPLVKGLAKHVMKIAFQGKKEARPVRLNMIKQLNRVNGKYPTAKLKAIQALKLSTMYLRSGENKARSATSWIKELYRAANVPWDIRPTSIPELPSETMVSIEERVRAKGIEIEENIKAVGQVPNPAEIERMMDEYYDQQMRVEAQRLERRAKEKCRRAKKLVQDSMEQVNFDAAFEDFLYWLTRVDYSTIKGPIRTMKKVNRWRSLEGGGYELKAASEITNDCYCVNPFNLMLLQSGEYVEIHKLQRQTLADMRGVDGYSTKEIDLVLSLVEMDKIKPGWFTMDDETEAKKALREKKDQLVTIEDPKTEVLALEFHGNIKGSLLIEWGINDNLKDENKLDIDENTYYDTNAWLIGDHIIKAVVNPDGLGRRPYHTSSWSKKPGEKTGEGLVEFAGPVEDAMNVVVRAMLNNISIASGPMAEIDRDRVDTDVPIYPWRQIDSSSRRMQKSGPAVHYYQAQMHVQELVSAFMFFSKLMDEMTVPAYAQGANQPGVTTGTATVFTALLAAASRSIKDVVANIDRDVIIPFIQMVYDRELKNTTDKSAQGDATIVALGAESLRQKEEVAQRKVEFLQVSTNPVIQQLLGQKNIGALVAQIARANDIDLPDMDRLEGVVDLQPVIDQLLAAQSGAVMTPAQANGQMQNGGGAPTAPGAMTPNGGQAGVIQNV